VLWKVIDSFIIDGVVNLSAIIVGAVGRLVKYVQNGDVQRYVVGVIAGTGAMLLIASHYPVYHASQFSTQVDGQHVTVLTDSVSERLKYRIKWEDGGDEKFSPYQDGRRFEKSYDMVGKKKITIEAFDPRWNTTSSESHTVEVQ
jgi:hypothetical protein